MPKPTKCPNCNAETITIWPGISAYTKDYVINLVVQELIWFCQCEQCHATWQIPREAKDESQTGKEANTKS